METQSRQEEPRREEPVREEPRREAPPREAPRQEEPRVEAPKIDSKALLESAGLVMVETDHAKAHYEPQAEEPQRLGRPRRERAHPQQDEELQQVETRK